MTTLKAENVQVYVNIIDRKLLEKYASLIT